MNVNRVALADILRAVGRNLEDVSPGRLPRGVDGVGDAVVYLAAILLPMDRIRFHKWQSGAVYPAAGEPNTDVAIGVYIPIHIPNWRGAVSSAFE